MSPRVQQTVEQDVQPIESLVLTPSQRQYLEAALSTYKDLRFDRDLLQHQMDIEQLTIGRVLEEAGIDKVSADEFSLYWTRGKTTSTLDKVKLLEAGVTMAQITAATITKPKKESFTIRGKGEKSRED